MKSFLSSLRKIDLTKDTLSTHKNSKSINLHLVQTVPKWRGWHKGLYSLLLSSSIWGGITLLKPNTAVAAPVTILNSTTTTATGAGATGIPSVTSLNIPAGKNRAVFIMVSFERDHCNLATDDCTTANTAGTGLSDNYASPVFVSSGGTAPRITARFTGTGGSLDLKNPLLLTDSTFSGDLRFASQSTFINGQPATSTTFFDGESYFIAVYESQIQTLLGGASSGTISITLPDVTTPKGAGDDATFHAVVLDNVVESTSGIVRSAIDNTNVIGSDTGTPGNFTRSVSAWDASQAPTANDGVILFGFSYLGQPTSNGGFLTASGFSAVTSGFTTNSGGNYNKLTEQDGISTAVQFRTGVPSLPITLTSAGSSSLITHGGYAAAFTIKTATPTVSGTIWDDANNSANGTFTAIQSVGETGTNAGGSLYAILVNSSSNVVASAKVSTDGTYVLRNFTVGSNYTIRLSTTAGTVGSAAPAAALPSGWINTSPTATAAFNVTTTDLTGSDFGIEQLPTAVGGTTTSQVNPTGANTITVAAALFTGSTDPDGTVSSYKITAFPSNATSITINGTNYTSASFPGAGVTVTTAQLAGMLVDPLDGAITVGISFQAIDNAGQISTNTGTVSLPFTAATVTLSGTVFEDPNYGGGAGRPLSTASTSPRDGATVELYKSDGTYLSNTITASGGKYTFANLAAGDYKVRVVNSTVSSSRPNPTSATGLVAVQTFRTDAGVTAGTVTAVTDHVGGEKPAEIDAPANTTATLTTLNAVTNQEVQSLTTVKVSSSNVSGIDFGYNFDTIVSTNNSGQGSLRQFVTNSNALTNNGLAQQGLTAGKETSIFMIPSGTAIPGIQASVPSQLTGGVAVINIATELPQITDANTSIDGTTQTTNVGNNNTGQFGTGGTVGVGTVALAKVNKPEVELSDGGLGLAKGLEILADDTTVRGMSIWGFGKDTSQSEFHNQITVGNWSPISPARTLIEQNIIGTKASDFSVTGAPGRGSTAGFLNSGSGIYLLASTNTTIQNNLIGFNAGTGILSFGNNDQLLVSGNELRSNGTESTRDGVGLENGTKNSQAINNLIIDNAANGVSIYKNGINSQLLVENNTIQNSGRNYWEEAGIAAFDTTGGNDKISKNIITGSQGAGIWLEKTVSTMTITKNSIYNNGGLGIDLKGETLDTGSGNQTTVLNTVTPNDGSNTVENIANKGTDYPIITSSKLNANGDLTVIGYVGTGIVTTSPFAGSTLEFFVANNTPANQDGQVISGDGKSKSHGEGQTYIGGNTIGNICTVATNGSFTCTFPAVGIIVTDPKNITATTTDTLGNTSEFSSIPSNKADVLFVKRITAIKDIETGTNTSYNTFVDDTISSTKINDNNCGWPGATPVSGVCTTNTYTLGATSETALKVKSGDEIEYTIYYLNAGENKASQVRICDQLDNNLTFKDDTPTTPSTTAPLSIQFVPGGGSVQPLTNVVDSDRGQLTTPTIAGSTCNLTANTGTNLSNNVVVVDVGTATDPVMGSSGAGIPTTSYGYIRFKTTVK